jgi:hypothetical protein
MSHRVLEFGDTLLWFLFDEVMMLSRLVLQFGIHLAVAVEATIRVGSYVLLLMFNPGLGGWCELG